MYIILYNVRFQYLMIKIYLLVALHEKMTHSNKTMSTSSTPSGSPYNTNAYSRSCGTTPNSVSAPMTLLGWQCTANKQCENVNQFTYNPQNGALYYDPSQCTDACSKNSNGSNGENNSFRSVSGWVPPKALL